jgi:hypothetical protein
MVGAEVPGERLGQVADLGAHPSLCQLREDFGSRCPAMSAASICRPDTPNMSAATTDSLIWASSPGFSTR